MRKIVTVVVALFALVSISGCASLSDHEVGGEYRYPESGRCPSGHFWHPETKTCWIYGDG